MSSTASTTVDLSKIMEQLNEINPKLVKMMLQDYNSKLGPNGVPTEGFYQLPFCSLFSIAPIGVIEDRNTPKFDLSSAQVVFLVACKILERITSSKISTDGLGPHSSFGFKLDESDEDSDCFFDTEHFQVIKNICAATAPSASHDNPNTHNVASLLCQMMPLVVSSAISSPTLTMWQASRVRMMPSAV